MANATTTSITPAQRAEAAKEKKRADEKRRREQIAAAKPALEKAGLSASTKLDPQQRARAATALTDKPGLSGKALEKWIMEGKGGAEQVAEAKAQRSAAQREERTRENITRSGDPEAASLAVEAKSLAPEVKSAFLPKDAREFLDKFVVTLSEDAKELTIARTDGADIEPVTLKVTALEKFAKKGEKDGDVRKALSAVGKDSRLWGRKLGLMALAQRLRIKGASA